MQFVILLSIRTHIVVRVYFVKKYVETAAVNRLK